jgi:aspartate carbamoyltransferase catalytic subunit
VILDQVEGGVAVRMAILHGVVAAGETRQASSAAGSA